MYMDLLLFGCTNFRLGFLNVITVIEAIVCFFSVWSIVGLAGFHSYLVGSELTTNEDIKGSFTSKRGGDNFNPYSKGSLFKNCLQVLCGPTPPSLVDRRGYVVPDSSQTHVSGAEGSKERESNSVNVRHEYYGSTTVTNQKTGNMGTNTAPDLPPPAVVTTTEEVMSNSEAGVKKREMISYQTPDGTINNKLPPINGTSSPSTCGGRKNHIWDMTLNQLNYLGRTNNHAGVHGANNGSVYPQPYRHSDYLSGTTVLHSGKGSKATMSRGCSTDF
ncbi:hypothetical protein BaRGS_00005736 [Batillaria attramentaria]|uniref:Palmitoyltransferase n=1 Tax=Batillaria attramentaria TaxID=370345 RepID=A0ABD0LU98_9CAEN